MAAEGLFIVGFIIVIGLFSQFIFRRFRIPDALLLIVFGVFLSFFSVVDGIRGGSAELSFLIIFSLIYVIFYGSLQVRLNAVFSTLKFAFFSAFFSFVVIAFLVGLIAHLFGFSWVLSFSLGAIFSLLDTSIIYSLLENLKVSEKAQAQIHTESAILDCFVIVSVLSLLNFASTGLGDFFGGLLSYLFLSAAIGGLAAFIWVFVLRAVGDYTSAPIATMAVLSMMYAFAEYVNSSGVVAVFAFSIVLGNAYSWIKLLSKQQQEKVAVLSSPAKSFFRELSFLVRTFMFVYLGVLVDFSHWGYLLLGLFFFLMAYAVRSSIAIFLYNKVLKKKELYLLDAMCAKGVTAIILLSIINGGVGFTNIVVGGVFSSVVVSSILVFLVEKEKFKSFTDLLSNKI